jgi:hypothetical protein
MAARRETLRAQQKHIAVVGQGEQQHGPAQAVDAQALVAGPIDQARRQQVGRKGHRDQLGDAQPTAAGKAAGGRDPADRRSQHRPQHPFPQHQQQGAADLFGPAQSQSQRAWPTRLERVPAQGKQGQERQQADAEGGRDQSAAAGNSCDLGCRTHR